MIPILLFIQIYTKIDLYYQKCKQIWYLNKGVLKKYIVVNVSQKCMVTFSITCSLL